VWTRVIVSGVRLLIAAVLCSLLTMPAAAHPRHDNDASALISVAAPDTLADQATADDVGRGERVIAAPALGCCGPSDCSTGCACGMASGSGTCGHAGGALAFSYAVRIPPSASSAHNSRSEQLLAGEDLCPGDRPPTV
jgi:hypothetical protein